MSVPANFFDSYDVVASPADATETVIAVLSGVGELLPDLSVHLHGWVALSLSSACVGVGLRVYRDAIGGTQVGQSAGVVFDPATTLTEVTLDIDVVDNPGNFAGAVYVLTAECTGAVAECEVSGVHLGARVC